MLDVWLALPWAEQIFSGMAVGFGSLLFGMLLLSLIGSGIGLDAHLHGDVGLDADAGAPDAFSAKAILTFLSFFGAGGWLMLQWGFPIWSALLVGLLFGYAVMTVLLWMLTRLQGFDANYSRVSSELEGELGSVYLTIPAARGGVGRIEVTQRGRRIEVEAESLGAAIPNGAPVRIVEVLSAGRVIVERVPELTLDTE